MKKIFVILIAALIIIACTRTENGIVFGIPDYEKRAIKVTRIDLEILLKAKELISIKESWVNNNIRICEASEPYNLYCVLEAASIIVDKKYIHRRAAIQEVRFTIADNYKDRWKVHRLADFNSHPKTTYQDVIDVLDLTINRIRKKLKHSRIN